MGRLKPAYRRLIFYLIVLLAVMGISRMIQTNSDSFYKTSLEIKEAIISKSKFTIIPYILENSIELSISIESFENPDILSQTITDFCFISLSGNAIENLHWDIKKESQSKVEGVILLEPISIKEGTKLEIDLFLESNTTFTWIL